MVFLGAESGSDETLKRMNKGGTASTEKTLAIAREDGRAMASCRSSRSCWAIRPTRRPTCASTIEFVRKVKRVNPRAEIILYMYTPVPLAGELYEQAKAEGFQFPETLEGWISPIWQEFSQRRSSQMPWLHDPLRRQVRDFERVLNAYYPTMHRSASCAGPGGGCCARRAPGATTCASIGIRWSCRRCRRCSPISGRRRVGSDVADEQRQSVRRHLICDRIKIAEAVSSTLTHAPDPHACRSSS